MGKVTIQYEEGDQLFRHELPTVDLIAVAEKLVESGSGDVAIRDVPTALEYSGLAVLRSMREGLEHRIRKDVRKKNGGDGDG
jgi:hypothetical protein